MNRNKGNKKQKGQGLVEYALILVLVAVVVVAALTLLGPQINGVFSRINAALSSVGVGGGGGGGSGGAGAVDNNWTLTDWSHTNCDTAAQLQPPPWWVSWTTYNGITGCYVKERPLP